MAVHVKMTDPTIDSSASRVSLLLLVCLMYSIMHTSESQSSSLDFLTQILR